MTEYTYNELNQLTGQVSDTSETLYLYDERGNQIHAETINEDESVSTVDMEYSVMGEMTVRTEKTGANTTLAQTNVYDHNGQRIKRTKNETARNYYYDSGVVLYTKDGGTVSSANILSDSGAAIGTYRGSAYHTYLKDAQGSTTNLVKSDGTLTAAYDYTDFGETTELAGASFDNQIRYTGSIYDEETGLYYLNARYYDPETGRFISQDSYRGEIDDPGQWHLYAYCANNPINYVDPSGHARGGPVRYKWNKRILEKGDRKYWYQTGTQYKGKTTKKYWQIGGNGKYLVAYKKNKTKCNNYKAAITACNKEFDKFALCFLNALIGLTSAAICALLDSPEVIETINGLTQKNIQDALDSRIRWTTKYNKVKSSFDALAKCGTQR